MRKSMIFGKKSAVQTIEAELATLQKRRVALQAKLRDADEALNQARSKRRALLIDGDSDDATARATVERALLGAERDAEAFTDALQGVDAKISDAKQRLADAQDAAAREKAASQLDSSAVAIDRAALKLDRAIEAVAVAVNELVQAIPSEPYTKIYTPGYGPREATKFEAAFAVLAEGLYSACEEAFTVEGPSIGTMVEIFLPVLRRRPDGALDRDIPKNDASVKFLPASGSAEANIVAPLRKAAEKIRASERPPLPLSPVKYDPARVIEPATFPDVGVVFFRPVKWIAANGRPEGRDARGYAVPAPVLTRAIELGVGASSDSDEGKAHMERLLRDRPSTSYSGDTREATDLGVDLEHLMSVERARLNGWDAPSVAEAAE
jgi:hypothetical protein